MTFSPLTCLILATWIAVALATPDNQWRDALYETARAIHSIGDIGALPIVTFVNSAYVEVARRWLRALDKLGIEEHAVIVAVDREACGRLARDYPRVYCATALDSIDDQTEFWRARLRMLGALAIEAQYAFVHCDVDAIWNADVSDAVRRFVHLALADMALSRGTYPRSHADVHGFAHCLGFWYIQPSSGTAELIADALELYRGDDQVAVNDALLRCGIEYEQVREHYTGTCGAGHAALRVVSLPLSVVARSCPTRAPVAHRLTDKSPHAKLSALDPPIDARLLPYIDVDQPRDSADASDGVAGGAWSYCTHLVVYGANFNYGLANFVVRNLRPASAFELGPGLGLYLDFFYRFGAVVDGQPPSPMLGAEPESMLGAGVFRPRGSGSSGPHQLVANVCAGDFPRDALPAVDLAYSIEVLEHVPLSSHACFADVLVRVARRWLVFSAARPGQGGTGHIAERPESEWIALFRDRGMRHCVKLTEALRRASSPVNINHRRNVNVFAHSDAACDAEHVTEPEPDDVLRARYGQVAQLWPQLDEARSRCVSRE